MDVLGMAQSRVSRHLAILREAGLLRDRRDGTYVFYRFDPPAEGPWREAWQLVRQSLGADPTRARDVAALSQVMAARARRAAGFDGRPGVGLAAQGVQRRGPAQPRRTRPRGSRPAHRRRRHRYRASWRASWRGSACA
jgi:DNA-binding transcriptional ArsR family regulator